MPALLSGPLIFGSMKYKIFINDDFIYNKVEIFAAVVDADGTPTERISYNGGATILTKAIEGLRPDPYLILPRKLYEAIETQIIDDLQRRGGVPTAQYLNGRVAELEKQVAWLQQQVETIPYIPLAKHS